jgi:hypothetical protein
MPKLPSGSQDDRTSFDAMKIGLAPHYRFWMLALLPTTLGLGTALLWLRSLNWPRGVDTDGFTLRFRRKVLWKAVDKISVQSDYYDTHVVRIDIHHGGGVYRVPVRSLLEGESIAKMIIAAFKQSHCTIKSRERGDTARVKGLDAATESAGWMRRESVPKSIAITAVHAVANDRIANLWPPLVAVSSVAATVGWTVWLGWLLTRIAHTLF